MLVGQKELVGKTVEAVAAAVAEHHHIDLGSQLLEVEVVAVAVQDNLLPEPAVVAAVLENQSAEAGIAALGNR